MSSLHVQVLHRAAQILGGKAPLRARLRVPMRDLERWLIGLERMPTPIFLEAVDVVTEASDAASAEASCTAHFDPKVAEMLERALSSALNETGAARGNIQLVQQGGLRIVSQIGFEKPFLDFFALVDHDTPSACGRAHHLAQTVVVEDVQADPIFAGTAAGEVMVQAGALACQSTPLLDESNAVIGMLSTHYEKPHRPSARELEAIGRIAQRASFWLRSAVAEAL